MNTVPGLWVFREPDRVVGLLIVAQAFGAGFVIADLVGRVAAGWRTRRALGPALLAGYLGLALGVHAVPAIPLLWSADGSGYVPRPLPGDYRSVLDAADTGLDRDSKAQAEQVRSIAVDRVGDVIGVVPFDTMAQLDDALRLHLAL